MVDPPNRLCKDITNLKNLQLGAETFVLILRNTVCDNHLVDGACIDAGNSISTEDPMGDQCIDIGCAFFLQEFGSSSDGVGSVCQIVDENDDSVCDISHKHHGRVLTIGDPRRSSFLSGRLVPPLNRSVKCIPYVSKQSPYSMHLRLRWLFSHLRHQG